MEVLLPVTVILVLALGLVAWAPEGVHQRMRKRRELKRQIQRAGGLESVQRLVPPTESVEGVVHLIREPKIWLVIVAAGTAGLIVQMLFGKAWLGILVVAGIEVIGTKYYLLGWTETEFLLCRGGRWSGPKAIAIKKRLPRDTPITRIEKLFGERVQIDGEVYVLSPEDSTKLRVKLAPPKSANVE